MLNDHLALFAPRCRHALLDYERLGGLVQRTWWPLANYERWRRLGTWRLLVDDQGRLLGCGLLNFSYLKKAIVLFKKKCNFTTVFNVS